MCREHYSIHTERISCEQIRQFVKFHQMQERGTLFVASEKKVEEFLTYPATERNVAASTQNQTFNVLDFLYKRVTDLEKILAACG